MRHNLIGEQMTNEEFLPESGWSILLISKEGFILHDMIEE
jgi:hypothetical protein